MANAELARLPAPGAATSGRATTAEPTVIRWALTGAALLFLAVCLLLPLAIVFATALAQGLPAYVAALRTPDTLAAVRLTLLTAAVAVPLNAAFGVAAAWALGKFSFRGKGILTTLIDLPFAVSPVVAGLLVVLLFGARGRFGPWFLEHGLKIVFAPPGIILATIFVTLPFVARELTPVMAATGTAAEEAALLLGASGWQMFRRVTLPSVRWGLFYGVVLCNARAMGEFGAVSVVSGHIRGQTNTIPLQVEILYNEYRFSAAFAAASTLTLLAVVTLIAKQLADRQAIRTGASQVATDEEAG